MDSIFGHKGDARSVNHKHIKVSSSCKANRNQALLRCTLYDVIWSENPQRPLDTKIFLGACWWVSNRFQPSVESSYPPGEKLMDEIWTSSIIQQDACCVYSLILRNSELSNMNRSIMNATSMKLSQIRRNWLLFGLCIRVTLIKNKHIVKNQSPSVACNFVEKQSKTVKEVWMGIILTGGPLIIMD